MAELYQIATGSKKISNLASISGISGSAVIPVVMSNVVGSGYPITNGTTNQISYEDFRESVIENNANVFTQAQVVQIGSGNTQQRTALVGFEFTMITGSGIGDVTSVAEGLKLEVFGQGTNAGVKFFSFDNTDATPANRFKTFMELGTGNGNLNLTRNVLATGNVNVAGNLGLGGNLNINQNLVVGGTITAQSYNSELVSSSIIYESGSTKFGDDVNDIHQRTGSLLVSGSSSVEGNFYVSGIVQNALLGAVTSSLITQNVSQNGVNLLLSAQTASQGLINTLTQAVTSSLINIVGGLQSYTASLKSAAIVSSSQQILNYNIFATTGSNTFRADQVITGSLSISAGEFNVTTGSGNMTSSLIFDHTQNDGVTLKLRHNDRLSFADHTFNLQVWAGGVYTTFVRNGTPYSILNVEAFDDNKIYIYRDTRLYNKSLVIDNNLTVTDDAQITGSLIVVGGVTGSLLATNGVVSSSNQLFELNNQTGSQNSINLGISIVTASLNTFTASLSTSATNINSFTASQLSVNILTQAVTSSLITQNTSQGGVNTLIGAVTTSLLAQTASQAAVNTLTNAVTSSLITQNTSQGGVNTLIGAVTTSLLAQTASQAGVNTLINAVTSSLITQNTSQGLVNNLTQAVTSSLITIVGGLQAYTASLKGVGIVSSSNQLLELNNQTGSQNSVNSGIATVTGSITNMLSLLNTATASLNDYSQSLKGAIEISGQNVNVLGMITAQQFNVTYVSSSVMYQSGSNKFGDTLDDKHQFTGSLSVIGGITGSLLATNGIVSSSNQIPELFPLMQATASLNTFTGSIGPVVNNVMAYTSSLKSAFTVSGTTTTHSGIIDTSENLIYSKRTSPSNVNSGATTAFTITQKSGEFQSTYMVSIIGLYDSGGSNQNGFYTGFVTFFTDGAIAQANISPIHANGWSATAAATTGGSFTITFTNSAATTMSNIRITALKINAT
jgi:hypothetical protein